VKVVLDASIIIKWLLADPGREEHTELATELIGEVVNGRFDAVQPLHWQIEVIAVMARVSAGRAERDAGLLQALDLEVNGSLEVMQRACRLSIGLNHHLFDTLYHAVALETAEAVLVTADQDYLSKARYLGRIIGLKEWPAVLGMNS